jgi:hypothetical protein
VSRLATAAWLADFQRRFGAALRTPLDAKSGTLRAQPQRYPAQLVGAVLEAGSGARQRLAVYNRQYWFRLLTVMQTSWPLTARLLGMFYFNLYAQHFLQQTPPTHYDLRFVTLGFEAYLASSIQTELIHRGPKDVPLPKRALLEAATLDAAFARVFHAPAEPRFDHAQLAAADIADKRLVNSAAYARVDEHWPLLSLRQALRDDPSEQAVQLPPPLPAAQEWALFRNAQGVGQLPLTALHARLLALLETLPLGHALAQLEAEVEPSARARLPELTQAWLAQGVASGFWIGLAD